MANQQWYGGHPPPPGRQLPYVPQQQQPGLAPWAQEPEPRRRRRLSPRARRGVEILGLLLLVPVGLAAHWYDDTHTLVKTLNPGERIDVVPHGGTGTLEHVSYRMVGVEAGGPPSPTYSGGIQATWDVDVKPLDAQGAKTAQNQNFRLVDKSGNTWNGISAGLTTFTAGQTVRVQIQAIVPKPEVTGLVLDVLGDKATSVAKRLPRPVLRLAH